MKKRYKSLEFDLDTKALEKLGIDRPSAYREIREFLLRNKFAHRQGSVYNSVVEMSRTDVIDLVDKMSNEIVWAAAVFKKLDVADISNQHELMPLVHLSDQIDADAWKENQSAEAVESERKTEIFRIVRKHLEIKREEEYEKRLKRQELKVKQEQKQKVEEEYEF